MCDKFRFKAKRHFRTDGSYGSELEEGRHHWMNQELVRKFIEPSINQIQEERLDSGVANAVLDATEKVCSTLGYE